MLAQRFRGCTARAVDPHHGKKGRGPRWVKSTAASAAIRTLAHSREPDAKTYESLECVSMNRQDRG